MTTTGKTKDTMITFKTTIRGKNSKGGDRTQLYLTQEQTTTLINTLTELQGNEKGVKLDIHTNKKEFEGRTFDSSFAFVKPTGEGAGAATTKKVFVPKVKKEIA